MVGVEVGQHEQRAPAARRAGAGSRPSPPGRGRRPPPRGVPAGAQGQAVALADVAGDQHPAARGPAGSRQRHQQRADHHRPEGQRATNRRARTRPGEQAADGTDHAEHADAERTRGPADRSHRQVAPFSATAMIHAAHQAAGSATHSPERAGQQPHEPAAESEHGGRTDRRRGEQVGHHGHQGHLAGDRRNQRRARDLRRQRHRDGLGHPARQPARHPVAPARREPEDARRRQRREGEAGRDRQPRVDQQQEQHRGAQRPRAAPTPVGAHAEQGHGAHHRGAQHAGLGSGEQHEPEHPEHAHHDESSGPDAHPAGQQEQGPTTSVRLVPETASRWVRPEVRNVLGQLAPASARRHRRRAPGTSARGPSGRWATAARIESRSRSAPRSSDPGPAQHLRRPARAEHAGQVAGAGQLQPPAHAQGEPSSRSAQRSSAMTSTGARTRCRDARDRRRPRCGPRKTTYGSKRPRRSTGSEVTTSRASTEADWRASASTAVACTASARSSADAATPHPATATSSRLSTRDRAGGDVRCRAQGERQGRDQDPGRSAEGGHGREPRDAGQDRRPEVDPSGSVTT